MLDTSTLLSLTYVPVRECGRRVCYSRIAGGAVKEEAGAKTAGCLPAVTLHLMKTRSINCACLAADCGDCPWALHRLSVLPTGVQKNARRHPKDVRAGGEDGPLPG